MITNTTIAWGDRLGGQMGRLAEMYFLSRENGQKVVFFEELKNFRVGYRFLEVFEFEWIEIVCRAKGIQKLFFKFYCWHCYKDYFGKELMGRALWYLGVTEEKFYEHICRLYKDFLPVNGSGGVNCDAALLTLSPDCNYNIVTGFGGWKDWEKYREEIGKVFQFKEKIRREGDEILKEIAFDKPVVSIHFRRTDYLEIASLNLDEDYYRKAMSFFDKEEVVFCVFSDDIEFCKSMNLFEGCEVFFMPMHSAGVDMYLMTQCHHNIIANSTYSLWGALLNPHLAKRVVCPYDFIGETDTKNNYMNGNYYPEEWIAL